MDGVPEPSKLVRQRSIRGYLMGKARAPIAIEFAVDLDKGVPDETYAATNPAVVTQLLDYGRFPGSLAEMAARRDGDVFVGIPYGPRYGSHPIGAGASTLDLLDLFDTVRSLVADDGLKPLTFREIPAPPSRSTDFKKAATLEMLLGHVAQALGHNEVSEIAVSEAFAMLTDDGKLTAIDTDAVLKAERVLPEIRDSNVERVGRTFPHEKPTLVLMARTERERQVMRDCVQSLFGSALELVERALPAAVHGSRDALPESKSKATKRFEARQAAWRTEAEALDDAYAGCHVLVQAADWYAGRPDDPVNKLAGRCSLATDANANVQYLLPPGKGERGLKNYLQRIQSAVYDLLFGHAGVVAEIATLVAKCFPDPATRPQAVMGLSVIAQARTRVAAKGGKICLATRIDASTGETTARVGWFQGHMRWSGSWKPFFEILKDVARLDIASIGNSSSDEGSNYQKFVRTMLDEACAAGDQPVVMFDSTSAAGLWKWLTDDGVKDTVLIGNEMIDVGGRWAGARLIRVRTDRAGRIIVRKESRYAEIDGEGKPTGEVVMRPAPTITAKAIQVGEGPHYWSTSGYLEQFKRGLSVYRVLSAPVALKGTALCKQIPFDISDEPYRLPKPIEITVARKSPADDADAIAGFVYSLRYGYGHTPALTKLPAPLSFESKVRDYMARFGVAEADVEYDEVSAESPDAPEPASAAEDETEAAEAAPAESAAQILPAWTDAVFPLRSPGKRLGALPLDSILSSLIRPERTSYRGRLLRSVQEAPKMPDPIASTKQSGLVEAEAIDLRTDATSAISEELDPNLVVIDASLLPSFVTLDWLRERVSAMPQRIRLLHSKADRIRASCPNAGWPDHRPTQEEFLRVLLEGFRDPYLFSLLDKVYPKPKKSLSLFAPFLQRCRIAAASAARTLDRDRGRFADDIGVLVDTHNSRMAEDLVVIWGVAHFDHTVALKAVRRHLSSDNRLVSYMEAVENYWERLRQVAERLGSQVEADAALHTGAWFPGGESGQSKTEEDDDVTDAEQSPGIDEAGGKNDGAPGHGALAEVLDAATDIATDASAIPGTTIQKVSAAVGGGMAAALAAWRKALARLVSLPNDCEPSQSVLEDAMGALGDAQVALGAYEAARPKLTDTAPLLARMEAVTARVLAASKDAPVPEAIEVSPPSHIPEGEAADADRTISEAEALVTKAEEDLAEEERIWSLRDRSRASQLNDLFDSRRRNIAVAVDRLRDAAGQISSAASLASSGAIPVFTADVGPEPHGKRDVLETKPQDADSEQGAVQSGADEAPWTTESRTGAMAASGDLPSGSEEAEPETGEEPANDDPLEPIADEAFGSVLEARPSPDDVEDPEVANIAARLEALCRAAEFGLAWHLVRATQRAIPDAKLPYQLGELAIVGAAGHVNQAATQSGGVDAMLADALDALNGIPTVGDDLSGGRSLAMFLAAVEFGVFQINSIAAQVVERAFHGLPPDLAGPLFALKQAVLDCRTTNLVMTPALLRSASGAEEAVRQRDGVRAQVLEKIQRVQELRFPFTAGIETCAELCRPERPLGALRLDIQKSPEAGLAAARDFRDAFCHRGEVNKLVVGLSRDLSPRDPIDGPGRDRLAGHVLELASLCGDFVAANEAAPQLSKKRDLVVKLRTNLKAAV
jgi:hypothetical protein